jgi:hypothetical protein
MSGKKFVSPEMKAKAAEEGRELLILFLYLAFFFCALAAYDMLLLREYRADDLTLAFALINALVVAKVILIGDWMHVGKRFEDRAIFVSAIVKAFLFGLLVFAFHVVEELIKRLVHGEGFAGASHNIHTDQLLARSLIIFCTFIPLFGFRELRRVMGDEKFNTLLFRSSHGLEPGPTAKSS